VTCTAHHQQYRCFYKGLGLCKIYMLQACLVTVGTAHFLLVAMFSFRTGTATKGFPFQALTII
jgi:hypothetical protein